MSRGIKKWTEERIKDLQKEGRGEGRLATYTPWTKITDFYSQGLTYLLFSYKTNRSHDLFSDGEYRTFVMLEWLIDNIDIREQFPMDRDITLEVAMELGLRHPYYPGTSVPFVMTLDFLVTRILNGKTFHHAYSVKTKKDVQDAKTVEKLEIERYYCTTLGIPYDLIISDLLPRNKVNNLVWIRQAQLDPVEDESLHHFYEENMMRMTQDIANTRFSGSLADYCTKYDHRFSLEGGAGMRTARMLLARRTLTMDLNNPAPERAPLPSFGISAMPGRLRAVGVN